MYRFLPFLFALVLVGCDSDTQPSARDVATDADTGEVVQPLEVCEGQRGTSAGMCSQDFAIKDHNGEIARLSDFLGAPVVLVVLDVDSDVDGMARNLEEMNADIQTVLVLAGDVGNGDAGSLYRRLHLTYPVLEDVPGDVEQWYGVPAHLVLDDTSRIDWSSSSDSALDWAVGNMLDE